LSQLCHLAFAIWISTSTKVTPHNMLRCTSWCCFNLHFRHLLLHFLHLLWN